MTERQIMATIKASALDLSFLVFHNLYSVGSDPGFPDLTICGPVGGPGASLMFYECKGPRGKLSDRQRVWIDTLSSTGVPARVIFEADLPAVYDDLAAAYQRFLEAKG